MPDTARWTAARARRAVIATVAGSGPDGIQAQVIARRIGAPKATVVRALNRLADDSLVLRGADTRDGRIVRYRLAGDR